MPKSSAPHQYELLAQYYDQFFTFHLQWYRTARRKLLGRILRRTRFVCDLACGTGTTAVELARLGVKVFAVDISPLMCRITRRKAIRARARVQVLQGDMRTFHLPATVDLITCEFDAVNHVPHKADFARLARSVARALNPGGHFYFDVNNRMAFEVLWPGTWWCERPGVVLVMRGGYDSGRDRGWTNAEWFVRAGSMWRRSTERVEQVSWTEAEIRASLSDAGFPKISSWDATSFFRGDTRIQPGCRTFYLARKSGVKDE